MSSKQWLEYQAARQREQQQRKHPRKVDHGDMWAEDSLIYRMEQRDNRRQGIYSNDGNKTRLVSQSQATRSKERAERVKKRESK